MFNDVLTEQGTSAGVYVLKGKINEKSYWVRTDDSRAIWYEDSSWCVGTMANLGTDTCCMYTRTSVVTEYPYNDGLLWRYVMKKGGHSDASSEDVRLSNGGKQETGDLVILCAADTGTTLTVNTTA